MSEEQKGILAKFGIFFFVVALVFGSANLIAFISRKNQNSPEKYGKLSVYIERSRLNVEEYRTFQNSLLELRRLGPNFVEAEDQTSADISIKIETLDCNSISGEFIVGTRSITIDPKCVISMSSLQTVFVHEIGHAVGMRHICRPTEREREDCSPVGFGVAVMNPEVYYLETSSSGFGTAVPRQNFSTYTLQALDFAEFNRVWSNYRRLR